MIYMSSSSLLEGCSEVARENVRKTNPKQKKKKRPNRKKAQINCETLEIDR